MRSTLLLLPLLLVLAAGAVQRQRRAQPAAPPSEEQVQERLLADQRAIARLQERSIAANTAFAIDKLLALTTDDVVYLPPGRAPVTGQQALRTYYEAIRNQAPAAQVLAYSEDWQEVRIVGDYAVQWGTISERVQSAYQAPETSSAVHAMRVLARQPDGDWKIARAIWNAAPAPPPH